MKRTTGTTTKSTTLGEVVRALLEQWGLLAEPLLYLSGYLKKHQLEYYRRLSAIRTDGDWEAWIAFFLEGVRSPRSKPSKASSLLQAS